MRSEVFTSLGNLLYLYLCNVDMAVKHAGKIAAFQKTTKLAFYILPMVVQEKWNPSTEEYTVQVRECSESGLMLNSLLY